MRIFRAVLLFVVGLSFALSTQGCHDLVPPNIIYIVGDDLGYADISAHGIPEGQDIGTPNIDRIAAGGALFTDGYVSCPVCSPTRAGLMTGRYQQRFGHENNPGGVGPNWGISLNEILLPEFMKSLGYATGMFGKWHLSSTGAVSHPLDRGFDEFYGFLGGAHDYFNPQPASANPILDGRTPVTSMSYFTYEIWGRALDFLERHQSERFFLYLPFNACHTPLQAPPEYLALFPTLTGNRKTYAAMMRCMDDAIGAVLDKVAELGLEHNTIVVFHSDNGGPTTTGSVNGSRNNPLRGSKTQTWEGGIRVPFFMKWPAHIPAGTVYSQPVISLDVLPTLVAAAGGTLPTDRPYDGVDLLPYVTGENPNPPHEVLYWRYLSNTPASAWRALRMGDWKMVKQGTAAWQLFYLAGDIAETTNFGPTYPDFRDALAAQFTAFAQSNWIAPLW